MIVQIIYDSVLYAAYYVVKIVPIIALGIFATSFAVNIGLMRKFDKLIKPLSGKANISAVSALAVVTCTFSTAAGYSMLVDGLNEICETFITFASVVVRSQTRREDSCNKCSNNACSGRVIHSSITDNLGNNYFRRTL